MQFRDSGKASTFNEMFVFVGINVTAQFGQNLRPQGLVILVEHALFVLQDVTDEKVLIHEAFLDCYNDRIVIQANVRESIIYTGSSEVFHE